MRRYIRARTPGSTCFFTVNLAERRDHRLLVERVADLREAFRRTRRERPFTIDAIVILPEHLHAVWTLPEDDADFSTRWSLIKTRFSRAIAPGEPISRSRSRRRERGIWQRRFWEHQIRDEHDLAIHIAYIHWNPVKHGLTQHPGEWPYSSFHRFVRNGLLPADWSAPPDAPAFNPE